MRINEILTQTPDESTSEIHRVVLDHCRPYLQQVNYESAIGDRALFRGLEWDPWEENGQYCISKVNQNRAPRNTRRANHNIIDDWFYSKFQIRFRSAAIFCTGNRSFASQFGYYVGTVIPAGHFWYVWSPVIMDLYNSLDYPGVREENIISTLEDGNYQFNTGLFEAIRSGHEIMIACNEIVLIDENILR